jgi:hypothetical protein
MTRIACLVQGDYRRGTHEVLESLRGKFDVIIVSTWNSDVDKFPKGDFVLIGSEKPLNNGITNRNLQRLGVAAGLRQAAKMGCDFVLKWRTDLLPLDLDVQRLKKLALTDVPSGVDARIVTCAFRNLTVTTDEFSSIPDLFAFSSLSMMTLLWDDREFDYSKPMNMPKGMIERFGPEYVKQVDGFDFCAETELYAIFKYRLQELLSRKLTHSIIVEQYLSLIDDEELGILWFGRDKGFRSIKQAHHIPWWQVKRGKPYLPATLPRGYKVCGLPSYLRRLLDPFLVKKNILKQSVKYFFYKSNFKPGN